MERLRGKRALVTGASAGIGAATARALAREGARVSLLARRRERLEEVAADCPDSELLVLDVRDEAAVRSRLEGERFDIALLNAGLALGTDSLVSGNPADWSVAIDTNLKGVLHVLRAVLPPMDATADGDIVLLGSVAGRQVYPGGNVYCATKHALRAIYEALRLEHGGRGMRFTTVDPGLVQTEFSRVRFRGDEERAAAVYSGLSPLRPEDVADAVLWAVTRPRHVNVGEIVLWATAQASTTLVRREPPPASR
jgi:3-hydroxy acid dehydrogenase/malonic semialdehyde reductase